MKLLSKIVDILTLAVALLLAFRIVLKFLGARTIAPFVLWLYDITESLMVPFKGIFPTPGVGKTSVIDIPGLFALVVYLAVGYLLSELLEAIGRNIKTEKVLKIKNNKPEELSPKTPEQNL